MSKRLPCRFSTEVVLKNKSLDKIDGFIFSMGKKENQHHIALSD